jgi:hypothetical protein
MKRRQNRTVSGTILTCRNRTENGTVTAGRAMELADTYRRRLRERALDQYGYVTTGDATDLGVPPVELRKLAGRTASTTSQPRAGTSTWRRCCGWAGTPI